MHEAGRSCSIQPGWFPGLGTNVKGAYGHVRLRARELARPARRSVDAGRHASPHRIGRRSIRLGTLNMLRTSRPSKWRWPGIIWAAVTISLAIGAGFERSTLDTSEVTIERVAPSVICQEADRKAITHLVTMLERNRSTDAPVIERSVYALNVARRHCLYGWNNLASKQYEWLESWLDEHK